MKVIQVIAPGPIAGAEKSVLTASLALKKAGCEVLLGAIQETRHPEYADRFMQEANTLHLDCTRLTSRGRVDLGLWRQGRRILQGRHFDIIHMHGYKALVYLSLPRPNGSALVATYHGATSHSRLAVFYQWIELKLFSRMDRVFVVSEAVRETLLQKGIDGEKSVVVPNMLSFSDTPPKANSPKSKDASVEMLFLGRLSIEKGLDVLIEALEHLGSSLPARLTVVGEGAERERLEALTRQKGLGDRIEFVGFQKNVISYFHRADLLVMPSRTEGLPMALIEAAALGKPVVGSRVGGIPEIVKNGVNGILVPPADVEQLAGAIRRIIRNLEEFSSSSQKMAPEVRQRFSAEQWARRAIAEYQLAIQGRE